MIPVTDYRIHCTCGKALAGGRQPRHQVVACPSCGAKRFVLPLSPWVDDKRPVAKSGKTKSRRKEWTYAVAAITATAGILIAGFAYLTRQRPKPLAADPVTATEEEALELARNQLNHGHPRQAAEMLKKAQSAVGVQLQREALILADLCAEPLEDILRHAASMKESEWEREWASRYQGKSVLIEAEFRPVDRGTWECDYPIYIEQERVRLAVDELAIIQKLPGPSKLIVGVRLAQVRREPPGPSWVVRFEPNSGVLLTQADAAVKICPEWADPAATQIFQRQAEWVVGK